MDVKMKTMVNKQPRPVAVATVASAVASARIVKLATHVKRGGK
jgi:hypothetical protein